MFNNVTLSLCSRTLLYPVSTHPIVEFDMITFFFLLIMDLDTPLILLKEDLSGMNLDWWWEFPGS